MKIIEIKYCYVNTRFQGIYQKRMSSQNKKLEKNASKFDVKRLADESKKQIDQFLLSEEGKNGSQADPKTKIIVFKKCWMKEE